MSNYQRYFEHVENYKPNVKHVSKKLKKYLKKYAKIKKVTSNHYFLVF